MNGHETLLSRVEQVALFAASVGASTDEVIASLGEQDSPPPRAAVEHAVLGLLERGLLRSVPGHPEPVPALTENGRRVLLDLIAQVAAVSSLQDERDQVERLRTDLLSTISHELRTPLTLIRTSIGLLLDSEPDEEMRLRLLRNIKQSTDRMNGLITDLLDLARLHQDRLELSVRNINVLDLIEGAVSLMRPLLDARGQRVEVFSTSPSLEVPGDLRRLERVLLNLLRNANKFAPAGTVIRVSVRDDDEAIVAVQDAGPGIAAEAIPHLFDQFFTDRTSSSEHNIGAGLGLPIAKGIVEAHGGHIWVESTVGTGTTVSFALPKVLPQEVLDEGPGR
ncbi:MAG: HAMP domain-containing histidine kinase [Chloroflexota bacterium]|nr:HAMP domain-containing histidine kinase [Chloroflexota bacterium]